MINWRKKNYGYKSGVEKQSVGHAYFSMFIPKREKVGRTIKCRSRLVFL